MFCIPKQLAGKLSKAFKESGMTIEKLSKMSSKEALEFFVKSGGKENAAGLNTIFEKALVSTQKQAMKNVVWKMFHDGKPLYTELSLAQSKSMQSLKMGELREMTSTQRTTELAKFTNNDIAKKLNDRFEIAKKSGNLSNWEQRVLGTKEMLENQKLKGNLSKLEALDDLGLLTPKQGEKFMESFVASKLGVEVTIQESAKISKLTKANVKAFDKVMETNDWTSDNAKNVKDYFTTRWETENYVKSLSGKDYIDTANDMVGIARNNILGSPRILRNSALYQILPSIERALTKRITSANIGSMDATFIEQLSTKISTGIVPGAAGAKFIKNQLSLSLDIYNKTGYDMARMTKLNERRSYIGETERSSSGEFRLGEAKKAVGEAQGVAGKTQEVIHQIAKATSVFPKWFAGGTDTIIANTTRAETSVLWSKEIARMEAKKGKLPKGVTESQRATQLLKESYSFNAKDPQAIKIREVSIEDAHYSNNTQPDGMADWVVGIRDKLGWGKFQFGKAIVPFAKISTTAISRGLKTAIPVDVVTNIVKLNHAAKLSDVGARSAGMSLAMNGLVSSLGATGATLLLSAFLDDDDYVPPYEIIKGKEYQFNRARGANPGSVRIAGRWISLRYLPIVNIPLSAVMNARRSMSKGENPAVGYMQGILASFLEAPVIGDVKGITESLSRATTANELQAFAERLGYDGESIWEWSKIRAIPSALSYDLYNAVLPSEGKYDFLGRTIARGGVFREDKSNKVILEFNDLGKTGYMPTISDPTGNSAKEALKKLGKEAYEKKLNGLKRDYADEVSKLIATKGYKDKSDENKKKAIDKKRKTYILNKL